MERVFFKELVIYNDKIVWSFI